MALQIRKQNRHTKFYTKKTQAVRHADPGSLNSSQWMKFIFRVSTYDLIRTWAICSTNGSPRRMHRRPTNGPATSIIRDEIHRSLGWTRSGIHMDETHPYMRCSPSNLVATLKVVICFYGAQALSAQRVAPKSKFPHDGIVNRQSLGAHRIRQTDPINVFLLLSFFFPQGLAACRRRNPTSSYRIQLGDGVCVSLGCWCLRELGFLVFAWACRDFVENGAVSSEVMRQVQRASVVKGFVSWDWWSMWSRSRVVVVDWRLEMQGW